MINYKEEINKNIRDFIDVQIETRKGWDDDVQRYYYHHFLDSMPRDMANYGHRVDELLDVLARSKQQIDALLGDNPPFSTDIQNIHERER